jgi:hypothetical protein
MVSLRYVVVSMALVSLVSACATSGRSGAQAGPRPSGSLAKANSAWTAFPVDQVPRPIVLISGTVNDPRSGFGIGDDKEAYFAGNFQLATQLPATTTTANGSAVISASQAFALLQGQRLAGISAKSALQVTSVQLGQASFGTDRGRRSLPAWLFSFAGVADPAQVLAIPTADTWQYPQTGFDPLGIGSATVSGNGMNLKVGFSGSFSSCPGRLHS